MASPLTPRRSLALIVICGCLISLVTFGLRSSLGLFTEPLSVTRGWGREVFALAIALQNLLWGLGQPFAGALADRYGPVKVLAGGGILYALGVVLGAISTSPVGLQLTLGVMVGLGLSGASFTIVIAGFGRLLPPEKRSWAVGLATASGSLGQFLFAPLGQAFIGAYGWVMALVLMSAFVAMVPALALALRGGQVGVHTGPDISVKAALNQAFGHGSYRLLVAGFFVCGFHVAFITTHLPPYLTDIGAGPGLAAWAIALVGLFNVIGSYGSGVLGGRYSKRKILSAIYFGRAVVIALFISLSVTPVTVLAFAAAMGLLWLSTVPPTSGLVAVMFGTRYLGMLFGVVFLSHQIGAFLGVWLGGVLYERTGSYDGVWWLSIALGLMAAALHWPIREQPAPQLATA